MAITPTLGGIINAANKKAAEVKDDVDVVIGSLFMNVKFKSSAGLDLLWKIECDRMAPGDWECLAARVAERFTFQYVYGVPKGKPTGKDNGAAFADACRKHTTDDGDYYMIVDDVWTTGGSIEATKKATEHRFPNLPRVGVTAWNRSGKVPPQWIASIFTYWG